MSLEQLLNDFAEQAGLDSLSISDEGACSFIGDDRFEVHVEASEDGGQFYVHATAMHHVGNQAASTFGLLLEANLFGLGTGEASFGFDRESDEVILFQRFDTEQTSCERLVDQLDRFLEVLAAWSAKLNDAPPKQEATFAALGARV